MANTGVTFINLSNKTLTLTRLTFHVHGSNESYITYIPLAIPLYVHTSIYAGYMTGCVAGLATPCKVGGLVREMQQ